MGKTSDSMMVRAAPTSGVRLKTARDERSGGLAITRHAAPPDLAEIIDHVAIVRWDLDRSAPIDREVLPAPCVDVLFGDHRAGVHGPINDRAVVRLTRRGAAVGVTFRPAGFRALLRPGLEPSALVDRPLSHADAFAASSEVKALSLALDEEKENESDEAKLDLVHRFLRAHHPGLDEEDAEVNALVDVARFDLTLTRVAPLAEHAGRPVRALERLLRSRVGVSAKWIIRRFRVAEAADRIARGLCIDLDALAFLLGYERDDLVHDFRAQTGRSPAQFLRSA
ncbi:MAG: AraC family transcriptional regulator [Labilithrix sp.]|nr:AraC family transcriptional regulator [Labilithrix sp.]MCW5810178.1 AraC family transcriptional regulator [Labilithrix sp.]